MKQQNILIFALKCVNSGIERVRRFGAALLVLFVMTFANSAFATDPETITDQLTTAKTTIVGYVSVALGLGLAVGIVLVSGALAWKGFKRLTS